MYHRGAAPLSPLAVPAQDLKGTPEGLPHVPGTVSGVGLEAELGDPVRGSGVASSWIRHCLHMYLLHLAVGVLDGVM